METNEQKRSTKGDGIIYLILGAMLGVFYVDVAGVGSRFAVFNSILAIGGMAALCSYFLNFCYQPGAIFGWYMDFLDVYFRDNPKNPFRVFYSPLGGCMYCQNTWVSLGAFMLLKNQWDLSWWTVLPTIFLAHFILTIIDRLLGR